MSSSYTNPRRIQVVSGHTLRRFHRSYSCLNCILNINDLTFLDSFRWACGNANNIKSIFKRNSISLNLSNQGGNFRTSYINTSNYFTFSHIDYLKTGFLYLKSITDIVEASETVGNREIIRLKAPIS